MWISGQRMWITVGIGDHAADNCVSDGDDPWMRGWFSEGCAWIGTPLVRRSSELLGRCGRVIHSPSALKPAPLKRDSGVIPVLPSTTAETGSPSIRKNEPCGRRHGVALLSDPALLCAVDLDLSLAVHRRIQRQHHPD